MRPADYFGLANEMKEHVSIDVFFSPLLSTSASMQLPDASEPRKRQE